MTAGRWHQPDAVCGCRCRPPPTGPSGPHHVIWVVETFTLTVAICVCDSALTVYPVHSACLRVVEYDVASISDNCTAHTTNLSCTVIVFCTFPRVSHITIALLVKLAMTSWPVSGWILMQRGLNVMSLTVCLVISMLCWLNVTKWSFLSLSANDQCIVCVVDDCQADST